MHLVPLTTLIPDLIVDLRYATSNNFTSKVLYTQPDEIVPQLLEPAAIALQSAANELRKYSLRLVVWDSYRPEATQRQLLAVMSDDKYVLQESNHCRGKAVDVALADLDGNYLEMGTDFDDFSSRAHANAQDLPSNQIYNRDMLKTIMENVGFLQWPYEWWHFDFVD